jgi:hypothetical protein
MKGTERAGFAYPITEMPEGKPVDVPGEFTIYLVVDR